MKGTKGPLKVLTAIALFALALAFALGVGLFALFTSILRNLRKLYLRCCRPDVLARQEARLRDAYVWTDVYCLLDGIHEAGQPCSLGEIRSRAACGTTRREWDEADLDACLLRALARGYLHREEDRYSVTPSGRAFMESYRTWRQAGPAGAAAGPFQARGRGPGGRCR